MQWLKVAQRHSQLDICSHKNMENSKYVFVNCAIRSLRWVVHCDSHRNLCAKFKRQMDFTMNWLLHRMWFNLIFFCLSMPCYRCAAQVKRKISTEEKENEATKSRAYWVKNGCENIFHIHWIGASEVVDGVCEFLSSWVPVCLEDGVFSYCMPNKIIQCKFSISLNLSSKWISLHPVSPFIYISSFFYVKTWIS